jgi:hypothetical protein
MTLVGMMGAATRDLFVGDSRLFIASYFLAGKWAREFFRWVETGEAFREPFVNEVLVDGFLSAAYAAAVGLVLTELLGLRRSVDT